MIDVREVYLETHPSIYEKFVEPVVGVRVGHRLSTQDVTDRIVWLLMNPGVWFRWTTGANWPVSAEPLNHECFDRWRGFSGSESERGLWVRFNRTAQ